MKEINMKKISAMLTQSIILRVLGLGLLSLTQSGTALAQSTTTIIRVPQNSPTIQAAIDAANPGDTILVDEGRWCGAFVNKTVKLVGVEDDTTIIACPNNFGPANLKRGFLVQAGGSGSTIRNFLFDGEGFSDVNTAPLAIGIGSGADNVTVEHNHFVGGLFGVNVNGTGWNINDNVFEQYTILNQPSCLGGAAIVSSNSSSTRFTNTFKHNKISTRVPDGTSPVCSWITEVDVPVGGIVVSGQDGTTIAENKISITSNLHNDAGAGVIASEHLNPGVQTNNVNLVVVDNDARKSAFGVVITTGNGQGAVVRENKGNNLISDTNTNASDR
jgi:hypothetical protein